MTDRPSDNDGLDAADQEIAHRLKASRPVPSANFRGALGRALAADDSRYASRPAPLRLFVTAYLAGGGLLIALGAIVAGGP